MKRAIALCGGGSRGSYEIGVWTVLKELRIDYQLVTGTSIGAINGALMVQDDYEKAKNLWDTISIHQVIATNFSLDYSLKAIYSQRKDFFQFLKDYVVNKGADITPFIQLLEEAIDENKVMCSDVDFGITTVRFPFIKPLEITKGAIGPQNIKKYLLASASCFPAFPMCKINGVRYVDGSFHDDLPINFALKLGAEEIIAVDLNYGVTHPEFLGHAQITYIHPSRSLGSFLHFDQKVMKRNQQLGYNDALRAFGKVWGYRYTFFKDHADESFLMGSAYFMNLFEQMLSYSNQFSKKKLLKLLDVPMTSYDKKDQQACLFSQFLRAGEICAEQLRVDYLPIYHLEDFCNLLLSRFRAPEKYDFKKLFCGSAKNKKILYQTIKNMDEEYLIGCIFNRILKNEEVCQEFSYLVAFCSQEIISAIFLFTLYQLTHHTFILTNCYYHD